MAHDGDSVKRRLPKKKDDKLSFILNHKTLCDSPYAPIVVNCNSPVTANDAS
jgi:hypothetical protein